MTKQVWKCSGCGARRQWGGCTPTKADAGYVARLLCEGECKDAGKPKATDHEYVGVEVREYVTHRVGTLPVLETSFYEGQTAG